LIFVVTIVALLLGLKKKERKKTMPKFKKALCLYLVQMGVYVFLYTLSNTPLYRETRLDSFIVLQIFKFSESFISISISLFLP